MRKFKKFLVCRRCGRRFTVESGDAVMPKTAALLEAPLCPKCRICERLGSRRR